MPEDSFRLPHPHAVRIAVATREAIESGLIDEDAAQQGEGLEADLVRLGNLVAYPFSRGQAAVIDVVLVDDGGVYRLHLRGSQSQVARYRPDVHPPAIARIVTTRAVVHAISDAQVRLSEAMGRGLVRLESGATESAQDGVKTPLPTGN